MSSKAPGSSLDLISGRVRGAYPIPLGTQTTAGFLGRTERGPVNEPITVESFPEYCRHFGGHLADGALARAVHDFFAHGGRRAVVVRVVNRATRARIEAPTEDDMLRLEARYPGRHETLRVSIDYEQVDDDPHRFNLVVQRMNGHGGHLIEDQELYPMISTRADDPRFIATVLRDSRLVALAGPVPATRPLATPPKLPGDPVRYISLTAQGHDGEELTDYDVIGSDRDGTGLFAFNRGRRIDLLAIPLPPDKELGTTAFVAAARYCEHRRALLIWDPPLAWHSADTALIGSRRLDFANDSVMTYFPRIRSRGEQLRYAGGLPACGAIAGLLAQRDLRGVFSPDENADFTLRLSLTPVAALSVAEVRRLARHGINAFINASGGTTRLVGRITLAGTSLRQRRLKMFILNAIEDAVAEGLQERDAGRAASLCAAQIGRFLSELHAHGALIGRTPGQAFFVNPGLDGSTPLPVIRLGFCLSVAGQFAEYCVELSGFRRGRLLPAQTLGTEALTS